MDWIGCIKTIKKRTGICGGFAVISTELRKKIKRVFIWNQVLQKRIYAFGSLPLFRPVLCKEQKQRFSLSIFRASYTVELMRAVRL